MQTLLALSVVATVVLVWAHLCSRIVRWQEARVEEARVEGAVVRPRGPGLSALLFGGARELPLLPEGHRPPPGLGPISPSERFLTSESIRGLRDLQLYLVDTAGPYRSPGL